ncbi:MAG: LamG domain-containing protein [Kiritimatiellae bacterium]|nr:LamG domain-containing protein [Kiritimatiellia bacterium]
MSWRVIVLATLAYAAGNAAQADTVAWWRFADKDAQGGKMEVGEVFTNAVNPAMFAATPCSFRNQEAPGTDPAYMPSCTNAFATNAGLTVHDPVSGVVLPAMSALHCPWGGDGSGLSGGAVVPADPALWGVKDGVQGDFTFECFFRTTEVGLARTLEMEPLAGMPNPGGSFGGWSLIIYKRCLWARCSQYKTDGSYMYNGGGGATAVTPNVWHHAAIVYTKSNQTFRLYLDYVFQGSLAFNTSSGYCGDLAVKSGENGGYLYLGKGTYQPDRSFDGEIAEARLSDTALGTADFLRFGYGLPFAGDRVSDDPDTLYWGSLDSAASFSGTTEDIFQANPKLAKAADVTLSTVRLVPPKGASTATLTGAVKINDTVGSDAATDVALANGGSLCLATNIADMAESGRVLTVPTGYVQFSDPGNELSADSFTQEMFFKTAHPVQYTRENIPPWSYGLMCSSSFKVIAYSSTTPSGSLFVRLRLADGTLASYTSTCRVDDGEWHHLAVVYDKEARTFSMWLDYARIWHNTNTELRSRGDWTIPWTIGAAVEGGMTGFQHFDGWIDEVRLTRRALGQGEFLVPNPQGKTQTLVWLHFDGDFGVEPYDLLRGSSAPGAYDSHAAGKSGATLTDAACSPRLVDAAGTTLVAANTGSLEIDGGSAEFPAPASAIRRDITVEFFVKPIEHFTAWSGPLAFSKFRASNLPHPEDTDCWQFTSAGTWDYSQLMFHCCTLTNVADGVAKFEKGYFMGPKLTPSGSRDVNGETCPTAFDGRWHHVAAVLSTTADDSTSIRLYYDYAKVMDTVQKGLLNIENAPYYIIAGTHAYKARPYRGFLDEVRISAGALEVKDFLRFPMKGLVVNLR